MLTGFFHPHLGGAERKTKWLAKNLIKNGHQIIVLCHRHDNSLKRIDFVDRVPVFRYTTLLLKIRDFFSMVKDFPSIFSTVKQFRPDVIYSAFSSMNLFLCLLLKILLNVPVISSIGGSDILHVPRKNKFFKKMIEWNLGKADMLLPVSTLVYQEAQKYADIKDKAQVIHAEVDASKFGVTDDKRLVKKYALEGKFVIMTLCRLSYVKRLDVLLKAFKLVLQRKITSPDGRKLILMICGDGEERTNLERITVELGISESVIFAGGISYDEVPNYLSIAGLYTATSEYEGFSYTTVEAMMSSLPIIATDITAYVNRLQGTGLIVPVNDPVSLSDAMIELIQDEPRRNLMGKDARMMAEQHFGQTDLIERFSHAFESVISS